MVDNTKNLLAFNEYLSLGWRLTPIRQNSKSPMLPNWNAKENTINNIFQIHPNQESIGICHAYSGTMALDIDDMFMAELKLSSVGINLHDLFNAPDSVTIISGKGGHGKLLYKMPLGLSLPSKKLIETRADGVKYNYLDFRCATVDGKTVQDVLPPSIHPETGLSYSWGGNGSFKNLPIIPNNLLNFWMKLIEEETEKPSQEEPIDSNVIEIREALSFVSPDVDRTTWVSVGMGLHHFGSQNNNLDEMFNVFNEWSSKSETKYKGVRDVSNVWRSFTGNGVTVKTMFALAYENGYKPKINPEEVFKNVEVIDPISKESAIPEWLQPKENDIPEWLQAKETEYRPVINMMDAFSYPAPDINMGLFPKILERRANEIASSIGADPLVPLFAGLSAVAGALDSRSRLELVHGFQVPPVIWAMTIGSPADKKSPASRPMFRVLGELEREDRPHYEKRLLEWQGKEAAYLSAHKSFLDYHADPLSQMENDAQPEVPELPTAPVPLKITVSDITSQKLVRQAADRPRGLLCYLDEMQAWIRKMVDNRSGEDRSSWVCSYESEPYEMDRVGAGSIYAENLAVSIYGNVQPRVFRENMNALSSDGLLQRFVPVILRGEMTRLGNPIPEFLTNSQEYDQMIRQVYSLPATTYRLSPDAYISFRNFQEWYEKTKYEERIIQTNDTYMTAFGKLEGLVGRIALLFHAVENPYSIEVSKEIMDRVIELVKTYIIPAYNYAYGEVGGTVSNSVEKWVTSRILAEASLKESITLADLKRSGKRKIEGMSSYDVDRNMVDVMNVLEGFGWVKLINAQHHNNRYVWSINPQLAVVYKEQREAMIRIRQERHEEMLRNVGSKRRSYVTGFLELEENRKLREEFERDNEKTPVYDD